MFNNEGKWIKFLKSFKDFIVSIALPTAITFIGIYTNTTIAERDRSVKYIEFASNILNTEKNPDIRDWAVDVINYYSEVKMSGKVKQAISAKLEAIEAGQDKSSITGFVTVPHKKQDGSP
jgi:hypothetical protein